MGYTPPDNHVICKPYCIVAPNAFINYLLFVIVYVCFNCAVRM